MAVFEIEAEGKTYEVEAPDMGAAMKALGVNAPADEPRAAPAEQPGFLAKARDFFTGDLRTEFPDAPEFAPAVAEAGNISIEDAKAGKEPAFDPATVSRSAITSDPAAQLDILRKSIPGLEAKQDKHGNVMLKAPGMADWAYLNKPGASARDLDEFGTQTLATLPFLGMAGQGASIPMRIASGAGAMGAASLEREALAKAQGSEQEPESHLLPTLIGGVAAPGVPTAILDTIRRAFGAATAPVANTARSAMAPGDEAARRVAVAYRDTIAGPGGRMSPEQAQHAAANQLQERTISPASEATFGAETRLVDLMGARGQSLARSAANTSPEARDTLNAVINPRFETQSRRTAEFVESLAGGNLAARSRDALEEMAHTARRPFYEAAFRDGSEGVSSAALQRLAQAPVVRRAIERAPDALQNKAAGGRLVTAAQGPRGPTLEFWDQVKRDLNDEFNRLAGRGQNAAAADVAAITDRLIAALDVAVPSYHTARGVAMGLFRANNALEAGENFVSSRGLSNETVERALEGLTQQERELFRQGFISRYLENINKTGDRRNIATLLANSPAEREKLELAIGQRQARELEAFLHHEQLMDFSRAAVQGNSTTARQLFELGLAGGVGATVSGFDPTNLSGWVAAILTKYGAGKAGQFVDQRVANQVAEMLVSRDPTVMRRGLQLAAGTPAVMRAMRRFDEAAAGLPRAAAGQETAEEAKR